MSGLCSSSTVDLSSRKVEEFQAARRAAFMDAGSIVCWAGDAKDMNEQMRGLGVLERHPKRRPVPLSGSREIVLILVSIAGGSIWLANRGAVGSQNALGMDIRVRLS